MSNKTNWKPFPRPEPDAILDLLEMSIADKREHKVNMTAGIYKDDELKPFLLHSVKSALKSLGEKDDLWFQNTLPPRGDDEFTSLAVKLIVGDKELEQKKLFEDDRVAAIQCQSGGTALFIAFELVKKFVKSNSIYISGPSWPIHLQMANFHGFDIKTYPYYNPHDNSLDFEGMMNTFKEMEEESTCILQPCGHNPTGFDPSKEQWDAILKVLKEKKIVIIFDLAYFGFATGNLDNDVYPIQIMAKNGDPCYITTSFSKNFGLYSGRAGFVAAICKNKEEKEAYINHMKVASLYLYGSPPNVGTEIVKEILTDTNKFELWINDLKIMSGRLARMRKQLYEEILKYNPKKDWSFLIKQIGMFSYTGLTKKQVQVLIDKYAVFLIYSGRISISGLNDKNIPYIAKALYEVTDGNI